MRRGGVSRAPWACQSARSAASTWTGTKGRLQPALLGGFIRAAADCEVDVESWLTDGAPMGVHRPIIQRGVFPRTDRYPGCPAEEVTECFPDVDTFANYASVEVGGDESGAGLAELQR